MCSSATFLASHSSPPPPPQFSYPLTLPAHWLPHAGTGEVIATVDADLAAFYRGLTQEQLDRTAIITVADHGLTMGLNYMYLQEGRVSSEGQEGQGGVRHACCRT